MVNQRQWYGSPNCPVVKQVKGRQEVAIAVEEAGQVQNRYGTIGMAQRTVCPLIPWIITRRDHGQGMKWPSIRHTLPYTAISSVSCISVSRIFSLPALHVYGETNKNKTQTKTKEKEKQREREQVKGNDFCLWINPSFSTSKAGYR